MTRAALACLGPGAAGTFEIRQTPRRNPAADEVAITVAAASVNPIDVRRAEGYGCGSCRCLAQARKGTRNYVWTLFRPEAAALSDLAQLVEQQRLSLPIAIRKPLHQADEAFEHIRKGRPGRVLLAP